MQTFQKVIHLLEKVATVKNHLTSSKSQVVTSYPEMLCFRAPLKRLKKKQKDRKKERKKKNLSETYKTSNWICSTEQNPSQCMLTKHFIVLSLILDRMT